MYFTIALVWLQAPAYFGSTCAACRLDALAQEAQRVGVRKVAFHLKVLLPVRCDLVDDVCRR